MQISVCLYFYLILDVEDSGNEFNDSFNGILGKSPFFFLILIYFITGPLDLV